MPLIVSEAHIKPELGTTRAVYGTDVESYLIASYCMYIYELGVEDPSLDLREEGARGFKSIVDRQQLCLSKSNINSFDYKGFNE